MTNDLPEGIQRDSMVSALWYRRDELRFLPLSISICTELARIMTEERLHSDHAPWCNQRNIDALLMCTDAAAQELYRNLIEIVGEDDEGLLAVECRWTSDDAEAIREATPKGQQPRQFVEALVREHVKPKGPRE